MIEFFLAVVGSFLYGILVYAVPRIYYALFLKGDK